MPTNKDTFWLERNQTPMFPPGTLISDHVAILHGENIPFLLVSGFYNAENRAPHDPNLSDASRSLVLGQSLIR